MGMGIRFCDGIAWTYLKEEEENAQEGEEIPHGLNKRNRELHKPKLKIKLHQP